MDTKMRKRGWSISSDADSTNKQSNRGPNGHSKNRPRSNTDHSEDTLTAAEKLDLLNSVPSSELEMDDHHHDDDVGLGDTLPHNSTDNNKRRDDDNEEEDVIDMFGESPNRSNGLNEGNPSKKRRKLMSAEEAGTMKINDEGIPETDGEEQNENKDDTNKKELLQEAKKRLSKWAARLFDANRPRGLVEAPQIIPLNDEFLKQFGQREKEFSEKTGRVIEIDHENLDEGVTSDIDLSNVDAKIENEKKKSTGNELKVKISNLSYSSTEVAITRLCERYGPVTEVNLLMDENKRSRGRAYITFEVGGDGESFMEKMNEKSFEGRVLRISAAVERKKGRESFGGKGDMSRTRYWEKDITTKCFRCGKVGHMASDCPNEELPKPCPLCAKTGHDSYSCPLSKICFNCGVPGHINRECPERRGMPRRIVCGACFISGHHRWECRERQYNIPSYNAQCLVCGKDGHFMCEEMKWFFGLKGITCFNCGQSGHHGSECDRPRIDECIRNNDLLQRELERAEAVSLAEEVEEQRRKRNKIHDRSREKDRYPSSKNGKSRAKSQPPSRSFQPNHQSSSYGRIQGSNKRRREESTSPPPNRGRQMDSSRRGYNDEGRNRSSSRGKRRNHGNKRGYN